MTHATHDTQPTRPPELGEDTHGVNAPPKALFWGVIVAFVLILVGVIGGLLVFRDVLRPSQQQRVLEFAPFMRVFLAPTPIGGTLPTPVLDRASEDAAMNLLQMPIVLASETPSPFPAATLPPTATPLPTATPTPSPTPTLAPPTAVPVSPTAAASGWDFPASERLFGITHQQQTWNNCGPATITMALSYYGWQQDQEYAKNRLKPNREDKNVSPSELVNFVNTQTQVRAMMRMGGSLDLLKALIANQFPVVVERGIMFEANDWLGHYQVLVAYDEALGRFYAYDSFMGTGEFERGVIVPYSDLDADWRAFNRLFIVVYNPVDEVRLKTVLGDLADEQLAALRAFETAQSEARQNPQDAFAWFNLGTSLVALERHAEAANAFDQARRYNLPWRMLWYQFGPFEAYFAVGRYDDVLSLAQINLNNAQELEETYYWRGRVYAAQGEIAKARAEFNRALSYNPYFQAARDALASL